MTQKHPLMKPLTSESLKPRPSTQAVWPLPAPQKEAQPVAPPSLPAVQPIEQPVLPAQIPLPEEKPAQEAPLWEEPVQESLSAEASPEEERSVEQAMPTSPRLLAIEKELADLLGETDAPQNDDDAAEEAAPDAIPSENMPQPAFVPLYEDPPPAPKRHGCLWVLVVVLLLAAGGGYALWYFDLIDPLLAWMQPAIDWLKAFVSRIADILP